MTTKLKRCPHCHKSWKVLGIHLVACPQNPARRRKRGYQTSKRGWRKYSEDARSLRCSGACGRTLALSQFHLDRAREPLGVRTECKDCRNEKRRASYSREREAKVV